MTGNGVGDALIVDIKISARPSVPGRLSLGPMVSLRIPEERSKERSTRPNGGFGLWINIMEHFPGNFHREWAFDLYGLRSALYVLLVYESIRLELTVC